MAHQAFWNGSRFRLIARNKNKFFLVSLITLCIVVFTSVSAFDAKLMGSTPYTSTGENPGQYPNSFNPKQSTILTSKSGDYLADVMDQYHETFDVYSDADAAGNHFSARGAMVAKEGDITKVPYMIEDNSINPHSGITSIECTFSPVAGDWSGWYFLNGNLSGDEREPGLNWGDLPNAGVNLSGSSYLTFWARGSKGGEKVDFFAFGAGYDTTPNRPYKDSSDKLSTGILTLSTTWTKYSLDVRGKNLSYVLGGFGWSAAASNNGNQNITFYLDDIQYDKARLDEQRFLVSYKTINSSNDFDTVLRNTAFTYDNAIALLAFIADNNLTRARLIADALVYAQSHDRYFDDGRIRNAYMGGDLVLPNGWTPNGRSNTVRMSGFYNSSTGEWYEDEFQVSTHTGNVAWAMIALLSMYENGGNDEYVRVSERMGDWVEFNCYNSTGIPGYTGGFEGWEGHQTPLTYKSTEHNIDLYVAFTKLYRITKNSTWNGRAEKAKGFLNAMWDSDEGKFWIGTLPDGSMINTKPVVLDVQAWSNLAFDDSEIEYQRAITYSEQHLSVGNGFDFNNDKDGVWNEGTAQMAAAYKKTGRDTQWNDVVDYLKSNRTIEGGVFATDSNQITTGLNVTDGIPWIYYHRLHVGATGWMVFAEKGLNPYWLGTNRTTKIGVYQNGVWYLDNDGSGTWNNGDKVFHFGAPGWTSVLGDWNGDGKGTKIGVYKDGVWYLDNDGSGTWNNGDKAYNFGAPGWTNITGDWIHDRKTDIGVTNGQQWYLDWNNNGAWDSGVDHAYFFGAPGWIPVVGDWNATGNSCIGITNGQQWYLDWNGNGTWDASTDKAYNFGAPGWIPAVGDWKATGKSYIGVTNGQQWYLDSNGNGAWENGVDYAYSFGAPGWIPLIGDWDGDAKVEIGVTNGQQWYLDSNGNGAWDNSIDYAYSFGAPGWIPVVGKWS